VREKDGIKLFKYYENGNGLLVLVRIEYRERIWNMSFGIEYVNWLWQNKLETVEFVG
jgi:hypothetical protein